MKRHWVTLIVLGLASLAANSVFAEQYARYAIDSLSIPDSGDYLRSLHLAGPDVDLVDIDDNEIIPAYGLTPFRFHARDFSVSSVESIESLQLGLTNELSNLADGTEVNVYYVPDSRTDLGVSLDEETDLCSWRDPHKCYDLQYDPDNPGGFVPSDFSVAPVSLGTVDIDFSSTERFKMISDLDLPAEVATSMVERINSGSGFHLLYSAVDPAGYVHVGSFNSGFGEDEPGADIRPQLIIDAVGPANGATRDSVRSGGIHDDGDNMSGDFYGAGNDDDHAEFGIAGFQFDRDDFGQSEDLTSIGGLELTLHHNDRGFSDGDTVEFFFVADTADDLGYDEFVGFQGKTEGGELVPLVYDPSIVNGIDEELFVNAPISLGQHDYQPKFGGVPETFELELTDEVKSQLLSAINNGDDFHILIAATESESDATFSGFNNAFDPGTPQLTITLGQGGGDPLDCNADGQVNADDLGCVTADTVGDLLGTLNLLPGDFDGDGQVAFPDFLTLSANFGTAGSGYTSGDVNVDGAVNFADFLSLSANFGQTAAAAAVPEPSSAALMLLGGVLLLRRRR